MTKKWHHQEGPPESWTWVWGPRGEAGHRLRVVLSRESLFGNGWAVTFWSYTEPGDYGGRSLVGVNRPFDPAQQYRPDPPRPELDLEGAQAAALDICASTLSQLVAAMRTAAGAPPKKKKRKKKAVEVVPALLPFRPRRAQPTPGWYACS